MWPGYWGGINWDGMAWDPERQIMVTTVKRIAAVVQLHPRGKGASPPRNWTSRTQYFPQQGTPYAATREPFVAPSGVPCTPPPWGTLVAVDLVKESVLWQRPLGTVPSLAGIAGSQEWGSIIFGGPLLTAGGLVFIAASQDDRFRAFDIETGELLWEHKLPAGGQAAPMTYRYNQRQYVVITAGGRAGIGSPGDWIVAFALPRTVP
jgi:quinoprotein glucose dehydrogenase